HQREQAFQTEQTQAADNAYQRVLGGLGCTKVDGKLNCDSSTSTYVTACATKNDVPVCNKEELQAYLSTIPEYTQLRGNVPKAKEFAASIEGIADQTAANVLAATQLTVFNAAVTAQPSFIETNPCRGDACDSVGLLNSYRASVPNYAILSSEDRTNLERNFLARAVSQNDALLFAQNACKLAGFSNCMGVDAYNSFGFAPGDADRIASNQLTLAINAMKNCVKTQTIDCKLNAFSFNASDYYPNDADTARQLQSQFIDSVRELQARIYQLALDDPRFGGSGGTIELPIVIVPVAPVMDPVAPAPTSGKSGKGVSGLLMPVTPNQSPAAPAVNTTTDLTPLQQLQLSAAQAT
ncbi:MAG: hypothetical protein AAB612_00670, partial [Patescibacteria group bacterium]